MDFESAREVYSVSHSDLLAHSKCSSLDTDCALTWKLLDTKHGDAVVTENWMFISSPKNTKAKDPGFAGIEAEIDEAGKKVLVRFNTSNIASFVFLEQSNFTGNFAENGWGILFPGQHEVDFFPDTQTVPSVKDFLDGLEVYSLYEANGFAN